jgi:predicted DNA-binding transcriptional regulator AlpA
MPTKRSSDGIDRDVLLDSAGVANLLGIAVGSVARYRTRGTLPPPDVMLGRSPGWRPATILVWQATRPGRTGRPRKVRT